MTEGMDPGAQALLLIEHHLKDCKENTAQSRESMREIREKIDMSSKETREALSSLSGSMNDSLRRVHERIDTHEGNRTKTMLALAGTTILLLISGLAVLLMYVISNAPHVLPKL